MKNKDAEHLVAKTILTVLGLAAALFAAYRLYVAEMEMIGY